LEIVQDAFYLPVEGGRCFALWRAPRDPAALRGCILHLPAFAEEMNKSRRMTAMAAREFARHGYGVLQIDPIGCGDSTGDFGDASLSVWGDNFVRSLEWLKKRAGSNVWIWALRAGALLVPRLLLVLQPEAAVLLWQPVASGKQCLSQFLRLRTSAGMLDKREAGETMSALRERLKSGEALEIAGYNLSAKMAAEMDNAELTFGPPMARRVVWIEVSPSESPMLSPAARSRIDALRSRGVLIEERSVSGSGFWQSVEIEECPALIPASLAAITSD